MHQVASSIPPWAVYLLLAILTGVISLVLSVFANRYARLENRVDKTEEKCAELKTELSKKADYQHLEKEISRIADRNHCDLKDIQKQITESIKTLHGRLDDLHIVMLNFLNGNGRNE